VPGVNNLGAYGRWTFAELTDVYTIQSEFEAKIESLFDTLVERAVESG
jgi:type III restriction enzyme